ncbi:NADH:ubiquinone oxidoreductase subunit 2 (subunit N) [Weissella uvarum]|uniref:DUF1516 family protein n=1 Tax=Weissella uvarum TaxID=1479233 RepID=UPI0019611123|nr:DUF1516 family protein [Weissella uvarum]MBM7616573.1 NADH:ubiquinone oxidoreductase subunit 2 (subunit N) [Weissella uvarum]MCM0594967.1 YisL family protein [Weissella uvarum]
MTFLWIHLITWVVLIVVAAVAVLSNNEKISKVCMMIARLCYIVAIGSGIPLFGYAYHQDPWLTLIKVILAILLIGIIEMTFARKRQHKLTSRFAFIVLLLTILLGMFGMYLAGGAPLK